MNPYEILGLPTNCTEQELKQRYKQLAQIFHPDKGGSNTKFVEIRTAYEILIDPVKRTNFNDTGEVKSTKNEIEAIEELKRLFEDAMSEYDPSRDDILYIIKMKTIQLKEFCYSEITNIQNRIEKWEKVLVNIESHKPKNVFHEMANVKLSTLNEGIQHYNNRIEIANTMISLINCYTFSFGKMLEEN